MVRTVNSLVDGPALKSAAIYGRIARLSGLMILVSRRWTRSCMIFFRTQRCRRFHVLPDSRYSRYTREMTVHENPNLIATSEMLYHISRAPNEHHIQFHLNLESNLSNNSSRHSLSYVGFADRSVVL
ncbi:uncharacterized protein TNCV_4053731 [Trichonephila clavipes]|nr:uncharacterized protein TNCV_4053731 [Trichonephila clavipes]